MAALTVKDIAAAIEAWAPIATAQSYDNVGLQIGKASAPVEQALVALDLTPEVVSEAVELQVDLVLTHHPLIFRPLKRLTDDGFVSGLALRLAENGIALYAAHTNLDSAKGGVSFALARRLGLQGVEFLAPLGRDGLRKVVVYVPPDDAQPVLSAMHRAGGGIIGDYLDTSFSMPGTGRFTPGDSAKPAIGKSGTPEAVEELRVEMLVPAGRVESVVRAAKGAHPYEEMAYDVLVLEQPDTSTGLGAVGRLTEPVSLRQFLDRVTERLATPAVRYAGDPEAGVRTVAVCGGSGSDFTAAALRAGADAYVTADVTYHRYFDVLDHAGRPRMALIDAGHYETEAITEQLLVDWLSERFPAASWMRTRHRTSPMKVHVRGT